MKRGPIHLALALLLALSAGAADPHEQLRQILQQPDFQIWRTRQQGAAPPPPNKKFGQMLNDAANAIDRFWSWLFPDRHEEDERHVEYTPASASVLPDLLKFFAWIAVITAVVFIVILIVSAVTGGQSAKSTMRVLSRQQIDDALEAGDALALDADEWMQQVARLEDEKNFRAMYRALYLALLAGLHAAGKIDHHRNRTNWAYVQHFRGPGEERDLFGDLTGLFDRVWYGHKLQERRDFGELRSAVTRLTTPPPALGGPA